jgi:hypothetical protein
MDDMRSTLARPERMLLDGHGKRVFAHCGKCREWLAELRGYDTAKAIFVDDRQVGFKSTPSATGSLYQWTCKCGAAPQRRQAALDTEFAAAAPKSRIYLT